MSNAQHMDSIQEATMALVSSLDNLRSSSQGAESSSDNSEDVYAFTSKDVILYALGGRMVVNICSKRTLVYLINTIFPVGASVQDELQYVYENHEQFTALPSFYVLPAMQELFTSNLAANAIPGKEISLEQILHGEQYIEFVGNVPLEGKLISKASVAEVLDKGSGAAIAYNSE